ncbi:hypothetical protein A0J61_10868 [Choanephora cucurbitarum]|uniref:Uncharacterized protein n=1 Tax=Choanephora cucurbitarum TaxID=101091 RepID=A0A1C7MW92_9FUNG|nr:hypothetical protein A0J61_10868 [Choanephora cucurbitarum]
MHIKGNINATEDEFEKTWCMFLKVAKESEMKAQKGRARRAWRQFVCDNIQGTKTLASNLKPSFDTMNISSKLDQFQITSHESDEFVFDEYNVSKALKEFAADSLALIKANVGGEKNFTADLNKWLAIHNIIKLSKHMDASLSKAFDASVLEALRLNFKTSKFSKPARLSSAFKVEVMDYLADFEEDRSSKILKRKLNLLALKHDGAVARVLEAMIVMLNKMTNKTVAIGEKKIEDILEAVFGQLFKVTDDHDPHKYDNALFHAPHPLEQCRPDYVVEVGSKSCYINLIGEIKPFPCRSADLFLDTYRLGVFSVALLEKHKLKCLLAFQAKGLEVTFYLCFFEKGIYFMSGVEAVTFPASFSDYCSFGVFLDALYNVAVLYEKHCEQQQPQQQQ